jgi:transcription antitermination factor NusA-like protein
MILLVFAIVTRSKILAKANMRVMKPAENHSVEIIEKIRAIEASKSTEISLLISERTALIATGSRPRTDKIMRVSVNLLSVTKIDKSRALVVNRIRRISKISKPLSPREIDVILMGQL